MSSLLIKIFATIFMIIDHIGIANENVVFRMIGRLAFPLFAYQMAIGMKNTQNIQRHALKLLLFATICQIPYIVFMKMCKITPDLNILFTFTISNLLILVLDYFKIIPRSKESTITFNWKNILIATPLVALLLFLAVYINVDYGIYGILLPIFFLCTFDNKVLTSCGFFAMLLAHYYFNPKYITLFGILAIFDLLFILNYNGKKCYKNGIIFYIIYFLQFPLLIAFKYWLLNN